MKTIILFLLISSGASAQFLGYSESNIVETLKRQNIKFTVTTDYYGFDTIKAFNIIGCDIQYVIDKTDVCHKEIITVADNKTIDFVFDLIMGLDKKHYVELRGIYFHEEDIGIVEVYKNNNIYTFKYE